MALILLKLRLQLNFDQPWKLKFCHLNGSVLCLNTRRFGIDEVCKIERIVVF